MTNKLANPVLRLLGFLLDNLLNCLLFIAPLVILTAQNNISALVQTAVSITLYWVVLVIAVQLVQLFLIAKTGATVGKLLTGITIVSTTDTPLTFSRAFLRNYMGYMLSGLFFWLGFLWILKSKQRQGWHDLVADTVVTQKTSFGWLTGILSLIIGLAITASVFSQSINNIKNNQQVYQDIVIDIQTSLAEQKVRENSGSDKVPPADTNEWTVVHNSQQSPFADSNVKTVYTNANKVNKTYSNFPYGFWSEDSQWGLVNYENEDVTVMVLFNTPQKLHSVTNIFSSCTEAICYVYSVAGITTDNNNQVLGTGQTTNKETSSTIQIESEEEFMGILFAVSRVGQPESYVHWQKMKFEYK